MEVMDVARARATSGLRLGLVAGLPSPWGEAAKGMLEIKGIPFVAVPYAGSGAGAEFEAWTGVRSAPVALLDDEAPRSGWAEILLLAERLAPAPPLIPRDAQERVTLFGLAHEICGEMGLGWCARLMVIDGGLNEAGHPLPREAAAYFAGKYGYRPGCFETARERVRAVLGLLADRLAAQAQAGSPYLIGSTLTAVDVYAATFAVLYAPWPHAQCPMPEFLRGSFARVGEQLADAVDARLLRHRDFVYETHLSLPVELVA